MSNNQQYDGQEALLQAMAQLLNAESSEKAQEYKNLILKRIAEESDVKPTRIPTPRNITEVGGYYNLIEQVQTNSLELEQKKIDMQLALIASALGLPV
ncbi:hypothetical protein [Butyrivibrio sp. MC2021]|uniref:hypothetical protein n=1 Tax=Butyrivibrio sp. MC2021 TaxID=1408306 RepID=UPI000685FC17|nr:hypothetical protein [Butyrivibrio sp. MC2021]